eukprot:TRINITY_DN4291_c0_g1_i1.p1 TRINITY_DN4291_c0_g1~~TRINITY_DN4291_c0_g1_i1.p1  ORF type:complete len:222 (-),score=75.03 TRINITY_DN4291_c0_g1_i1:343-1008(-)
MYSTKRVNEKIAEGYISVGDPYRGTKDTLPGRWKGKGFKVLQVPVNAENGNFSKLEYKSCAFQEMERYSKTQPDRKKGFGTKDAFRRGEFTATIRTEQYRDQLRKEQTIMAKFCDPVRDSEIIRRAEEKQRSTRTFCEGLPETDHLYDVGRTQVTKFDPKRSRDRFYTPDINRERRMGGFRTMAQDIGDGAWSHKYKSPEFGPIHHTKLFWDRSHLTVEGV